MSEQRYNAFISYRHVERDKEIAIGLQKLLETYKPPKNGIYKNTTKIRKVFRDESELPTSGDLGADIKSALERSDYLIVICSEDTSRSQWCMQEIEYFKQLRHGQCNDILTLLVSGNPREVFPEALCYETKLVEGTNGEAEYRKIEVEPLAANVVAKSIKESRKKLNTEFLRIAAPILGCSFDDLYQRHQRRYIRKIITAATAIITLTIAFSIYAVANINLLNSQARQILEKKAELETANEELIEGKQKIEDANQQLEQKNDELQEQIDETTKQRNIADEQKIIAEENEQKAIVNMNYANEQKALAEENYSEAKRQEQLANENRSQAEENLSIAEQQKNLALSSQSRFLADLSNQLLTQGDRMTALMLALEGLPDNLKNPDRPYVKQEEDALRKALLSFETSSDADNKGVIYQSILKHTDVKGYCTGKSPDRIYTISNETIRLWNTENGALVDEITINPNGEMTYVFFQESDQYIMIEAFDYVYNQLTYDTVTTGDVYLIKKDCDSIILSAEYKNTQKILESKKDYRAILVKEDGTPVCIDYNHGIITDKKILTKLFAGLVIEDYRLSGDISRDGQYLSICEVNFDKMHIASMSTGKILKTIDENIWDSYFLSDNSLLYSIVGHIYRYASGSMNSLEEIKEVNMLSDRSSILWFDDSELTLYMMSPETGTKKSVRIGVRCDNIEISPDDQYATLYSSETGTFCIVSLSHMAIIKKQEINEESRPEGSVVVTLSPDKKYLLCYNPFNGNHTIILDSSTMKEIAVLSKTDGDKISNACFLTEQKVFLMNNDSSKIIEIAKPDSVKYFDTTQYYDFADFGDPEGKTIIFSNAYTLFSNDYDVVDVKSGNILSEWDKELSYAGGFRDLKKNESILINIRNGSLFPVFVQNNTYADLERDQVWELQGCHISKDGKKYLLSYDSRIVIYEVGSGSKTVIQNPTEQAIQGAVFHPDNKTVSMLLLDRIICYDCNSGALLEETLFNNQGYTNMKVSPMGDCFILYSGKEDIHSPGGKSMAVYNSYSGELLYEKLFDHNILDADASGDGSKLLLAFNDMLKVISLSNGEELQELPCPSHLEGSILMTCSISYDGTRVLAHYPYSTNYIWDISYDPEKLIKEAKELLKGRVFTEEERKEYYLE